MENINLQDMIDEYKLCLRGVLFSSRDVYGRRFTDISIKYHLKHVRVYTFYCLMALVQFLKENDTLTIRQTQEVLKGVKNFPDSLVKFEPNFIAEIIDNPCEEAVVQLIVKIDGIAQDIQADINNL